MKKILLMLVAEIILAGCGRAKMESYGAYSFTVGKVEIKGDHCIYVDRLTAFPNNAAFCDTCGKFNIGDTIIFIKK